MGIFRKLNSLAHMNCRQASEMYSRSMDDGLPVREQVRFYIHFFACAPCRFYVAQLKWLREAMIRYRKGGIEGVIAPARKLTPEARARISSAVAEASAAEHR